MILNVHDTFPELFATKFSRPQGHRVVRVIRAEERSSSARFADRVIVVTEAAREASPERGVGPRRRAWS